MKTEQKIAQKITEFCVKAGWVEIIQNKPSKSRRTQKNQSKSNRLSRSHKQTREVTIDRDALAKKVRKIRKQLEVKMVSYEHLHILSEKIGDPMLKHYTKTIQSTVEQINQLFTELSKTWNQQESWDIHREIVQETEQLIHIVSQAFRKAEKIITKWEKPIVKINHQVHKKNGVKEEIKVEYLMGTPSEKTALNRQTRMKMFLPEKPA